VSVHIQLATSNAKNANNPFAHRRPLLDRIGHGQYRRHRPAGTSVEAGTLLPIVETPVMQLASPPPAAPVAGRGVTEPEVSDWMHAHLRIAVLPLEPNDVSAGERELLHRADPPLNLSGVDRTPLRQTLSRLRSALKEME